MVQRARTRNQSLQQKQLHRQQLQQTAQLQQLPCFLRSLPFSKRMRFPQQTPLSPKPTLQGREVGLNDVWHGLPACECVHVSALCYICESECVCVCCNHSSVYSVHMQRSKCDWWLLPRQTRSF